MPLREKNQIYRKTYLTNALILQVGDKFYNPKHPCHEGVCIRIQPGHSTNYSTVIEYVNIQPVPGKWKINDIDKMDMQKIHNDTDKMEWRYRSTSISC